MKWMQFFTPVASINWDEADKLVAEHPQGDVIFLDVRQPSEYEDGHMPGAKLVPLGELDSRLGELARDKHTVIYWAIGGRSRVAAQLLSGKGFTHLYNLAGGIRSWGKEVAVGSEDSGLHLFTRMGSAEEAVVIGFGLEMGLRDFYTSMQSRVKSEGAKALFAQLADIEILHQERLVQLYRELTGTAISEFEFAARIAEPAMEGGLTTEEYLQRFHADPGSDLDVLGLALSIEAQALDLYLRAAENSDNPGAQKVLRQIADEERSHIERLGQFIDNR